MSKRHTDNKLWVRIVALVMAGLMLLGVLVSASSGLAEEETAGRDQYSMELTVLPEQQAVHVHQTTEYVNRSGATQNGAYFSLYLNALRRQTSVPVEADQFENAFPNGYAPGGVDFIGVKVNGEAAEWGMLDGEETYLRVGCSLEAGERAQVEFEYYVLLPDTALSMGTGDKTWRLTHFYPAAALYDGYLEAYPEYDYTPMAEPLIGYAADFSVSLALPEGYALAAPGEISAAPEESGMVRYEIRAEGVRALSLAFGRGLTERTGQTASGTQVRALGSSALSAQALLDAVLPSLGWLEENLGGYAWPCLTVIETECMGGASFPGVIQMPASLTGLRSRSELADKAAELCARQYFSCIVGSNQSEAPWLSEALTSYVRLLYCEAAEGRESYLKRLNEQVLPALNTTIPGGVTVDSGAVRFNSVMEFEMAVTDRGTAVLHEMRGAMGNEAFMQGLRGYVQNMYLKHATAADFLAAMNEASGSRWNEYLYGQFHNMDDYVGTGLDWFE